MSKTTNWTLGTTLLIILGILMIVLITQSRENRKEMEIRAEQNVLLVKVNIQESYTAALEEIREQYKTKFYLLGNGSPQKEFVKKLTGGDKWKGYPLSVVEITDQNKSNISFEKDQVVFKNYSDIAILKWLETNHWKNDDLTLSFDIDFKNDESKFSSDNYLLDFSFPIKTLVARDSRSNTFFDELMLLDSVGLVHYPPKWEGIKLNLEKDSLSVKKSGTQVLDMNLLNQNYTSYVTDIQLGELKFKVLGAISEESLEQASYQVNHKLLVLLLLMVVLLFVGIPIFSLDRISFADILTQAKAINAIVSLVFLLAVVGWTSSYFLSGNNSEFLDYEQETIASLKKQIEYLDTIESYRSQDKFPKNLTNYLRIKEKLKINKDGQIISFSTYNSSDNTFCLLGTDSAVNFISVADRDYFKIEKIDTFFLSRHFSRKDGSAENVISIKSDDDTVEALTYEVKLGSLYKDANRRYLVIKKEGHVIYASSAINVPIRNMKNIISKEKWEEMELLTERDSTEQRMFLWLNGNEFEARMRKLDFNKVDSPLFLVYLIDSNPITQFYSIIALESIATLLLYFLLLVLIFGLCYVRKNRKYYNWKRFYFYPLVYNPSHGVIYRTAVLSFIGLIVTPVFLIFFSHLTLYLVIGFLIFNVLASVGILWYSYWIELKLNSGKLKNQAQPSANPIQKEKDPGIANASTTKRSSDPEIRSHQDSIKGTKTSNYFDPARLYSLMIFLLFIAVAFIPAFLIHQTHLTIEKQIWNTNYHLGKSKIDFFGVQTELNRRNFILSVFDKQEKDLKNFAFANFEELNKASSAIKTRITLNLENLMLVGFIFLIVFLGYKFTHRLLHAVFFDKGIIRPFSRVNQEFNSYVSNKKSPKIFLSGLQTELMVKWVKDNLKLKESEIKIFNCNRLQAVSATSGTNDKQTILPLTRSDGEPKPKAVVILNIHCLSKDIDLISQLRIWLDKFDSDHLILGSGYSLKQIIQERYGLSNIGSPSEEKEVQITALLSDFLFGYIPIPTTKPDFKYSEERTPSKLGQRYNQELWDVIQKMNSKPKGREKEKNLKLWQLMIYQRHLKAYFLNLWSELNFEEKKLCYYFAKEGFINSKNLTVLIELVQKGLLQFNETKGRYYYFDKTFRFFVLNHTSRELKQAFEADTKNNGSMRGYQWIVVSFVFLVLGLITYFNRGFLTQLEAISTALVGALGIIINGIQRILPNFSFWKSKE